MTSVASTARLGTAHFLLDEADSVGLGELEHGEEWPFDKRGGCQRDVVGCWVVMARSSGEAFLTIVMEPFEPLMEFAVAMIGGAIFGIFESFRDMNRLIQP